MILKKQTENLEERNMGWMVSFSDVITLLITFFVLIISMSSMDQKAIKKSFTYFSGAPGIYGEQKGGSKNFIYLQKKYDLTLEDYKRYLYLINRYSLVETQAINILKLEKILGERYKYDIDGNDVVMKLNGDELFIEYSTDFSRKGLNFAEKLYKITNMYKRKVIINVYTSDFPVKTATIKNNIDLSIKRGIRIVNLLSEYGVDIKRISLMGWGSKKIKKDIINIIFKDFLKI